MYDPQGNPLPLGLVLNCQNCKHWQLTSADAYTDKHTGHQHAPCEHLTNDGSDFVYFADYQTYDEAQMITRDDFGCNLWTMDRR